MWPRHRTPRHPVSSQGLKPLLTATLPNRPLNYRHTPHVPCHQYPPCHPQDPHAHWYWITGCATLLELPCYHSNPCHPKILAYTPLCSRDPSTMSLFFLFLFLIYSCRPSAKHMALFWLTCCRTFPPSRPVLTHHLVTPPTHHHATSKPPTNVPPRCALFEARASIVLVLDV